MPKQEICVITVGLNPAIDRVIEVPGFRIGGHQQGTQKSRSAAGKAVNVSRALARLGVRSIAAGFVGRDQMDYFEQVLDSPRIAAQFLPVQGQTRENVTIVDPESNAETHIRDQGFVVGEKDVLRIKRKLALICRKEVIVVFSGSLPPGLGPQDFLAMVEIARKAGARVAVDTSGPALTALAEGPLWLVKPNRQELAEIVGRQVENDEALIAAGLGLTDRFQVVLVSCGSAGGYAFVGGHGFLGQVPVDQHRVVSTVGCGDALLAGFIAACLDGSSVKESYRQALAVATASATSLVPGHFEDADLIEFRRRATVEPVTAAKPAGSGVARG